MEITHDTAHRKFSVPVEGGEGVLLYRRGPQNSYDLYSTVVPPEARGKNVADQLVRKALQAAKDENVKVIPTCPYIAKWFERHPEESSLLLRDRKSCYRQASLRAAPVSLSSVKSTFISFAIKSAAKGRILRLSASFIRIGQERFRFIELYLSLNQFFLPVGALLSAGKGLS